VSPSELLDVIDAFKNDPTGFNEICLRRPAYWSKQVEICDSFVSNRITVACTGNGVGKSYVAAGLLIWALICHPGCKVLSSAPSNQLLSDVLWGEVRQAWNRSIFKDLFAADIKANPQRLVLADGWDAVGWSSDSTAKMSGRHRGDLFWILDESSDIMPEVWEGIWSNNPSKVLILGNPLKPSGDMHRLATNPGPQVNVLQVSSLDSPDIHLPRSRRGMADATWLQGIREVYGEGSPYWQVHVEGRYTDEDIFTLIPGSWLDRCTTPHPTHDANGQVIDHGPLTLSVDLSKGTGRGDSSVIIVRDHDSIHYMDWSSTWRFPEGVGERVKQVAAEYKIPGNKITYDSGGLGEGFGFILSSHFGLSGAYGYVGGETGGRLATNFRGASALAMKNRLDPSRNPRHFHVPQKYLDTLKPQIAELRYELAGRDQIKIESKDKMKVRLGRSPDHLDAAIQSWSRN
jgi:phage terminase large subunit